MEEGRQSGDYAARINRSCDYIRANLGSPLNLKTLAETACFSPYHFHRIFTSLVGQTPRDYVEEKRLDWAANSLALRPDLSITDIALEAGYSSPTAFSRSFKTRFGTNAASYRAAVRHLKAPGLVPGLPPHRRTLESFDPGEVQIQRLAPAILACARARSSYAEAVDKAWDEILHWARARELLRPETQLIGLPWDNPDITPRDRVSYFACVSLPTGVSPSRGISLLRLEGGLYGVYPFSGPAEDIESAYGALYGRWLPRSGYLPDQRPGIELYPPSLMDRRPGDPLAYDICIPLVPY